MEKCVCSKHIGTRVQENFLVNHYRRHIELSFTGIKSIGKFTLIMHSFFFRCLVFVQRKCSCVVKLSMTIKWREKLGNRAKLG